MKSLAIALILAAGGSVFVPGPAPGQRVTTADQQYYFDPLGSDSNPCTGTGVAACLTAQGAINKSPKVLRHRLTVTGAAGNYTGLTISGFTTDPAFQKSTAGILLEGALANVTPTTGSATGTASSGTAGSGSTFGTLTDPSATWTVNDAAMVGKYVVITGGTGSGQVRPIASNTSTVLTIAGSWTAPTGTSTYAIQSPSVNITVAAAAIPSPTGTNYPAAGIQIVNNTIGTYTSTIASEMPITIRNIGINIAATRSLLIASSDGVGLIQVMTSSTTSPGVDAERTGVVVISAGSLTTTTGTGVGSVSSILGINNSRVSTSTGIAVLSTAGGGTTQITSSQLSGRVGFSLQGGSTGNLGTSRCDCGSQSDSACLSLGSIPSVVALFGASTPPVTASFSGSVDVTNCSHGIFASNNSSVTASSSVVLSGNALTYAVNAIHGAAVVLPTATTTITGATAAMSVDTGASTAAFGTLSAPFSCLLNLATTSRICRL